MDCLEYKHVHNLVNMILCSIGSQCGCLKVRVMRVKKVWQQCIVIAGVVLTAFC